jgi:renal tumor antigen
LDHPKELSVAPNFDWLSQGFPQISANLKYLNNLSNKDGEKLALVFELMDMNLYELISGAKTYLPSYRIKYIIFQVLKAIYHMHKNGIFHRDIKPENILIRGDDIKLADFGCCKGIFAEPPYTEYISTRWYRPPECLLTDGFYDSKIDIWGIGCVLFEVISLNPLFPGDDELDQINKIHKVLGTPSPEVLALYQQLATHMDFDFKETVGCGIEAMIGETTPDCLDILKKLLAYEPHKRISAGEALRHEYFHEILEKEMEKEFEKSL